MSDLYIKNSRILNPGSSVYNNADITIKNGTITDIGEIPDNASPVLNGEGRIAVPGFIDVHLQGAGGADVLDNSAESLEIVAKTAARFGITSFLATTVFRPKGDNKHLETLVKNMGKPLQGAECLGIHLEGPFISFEKKGMIPPACICAPSLRIMDTILELTAPHLRMMTIAPETEGTTSVIRDLIANQTVASFGHSSATYEETLRGFDIGITHVTHLFNAMGSLHHREPGPLMAVFETTHITAQVICDGVHLHEGIIRNSYKLLGTERIVLITDGLRALGLPDGKYTYDSIEFETRHGTARYKDGTLVGTALGLSDLLRKFMEFTGCRLSDALKTVTQAPASALGISEQKGKIEKGKDGDIVLLNDDYSVFATVSGGHLVFQEGQ